MERKNIERRVLLENAIRLGAGLLIIPFISQSCKSGGDDATEETTVDTTDNSREVASCDDLSKTPESEIKKREGFGYVEESPMAEKHCKNCNLYFPPLEDQSCGGCALFKGPVFEDAYCTYWAPIL